MRNRKMKIVAAAVGAALVLTAPVYAAADDTEASVQTESVGTETEASSESADEIAEEEDSYDFGEHKTIDVNGTTLNYWVKGEGKPVVLVHGNGGSHKVFYKEVEQLTDAGYQVYAPDSRGQGENEPQDEYSYEEFAEDTYQFITKLGLDRPAYYGWSDGGIIGVLLEISHPKTVSLLAISGTNLYPDGAKQEVLDAIQEDYDKTKEPLEKLMLTQPQIDPDDLEKIQVPTLVLAGSEDVIKQDHTELIADKIPDSELHIVDGQTHGSYIEGSDIAGKLLLDFFQEHNY